MRTIWGKLAILAVVAIILVGCSDSNFGAQELELTDFRLSTTTARAGESISVSLTVRNLGQTLTPNLTANIVLNNDAFTGTAGTVVGTVEIAAVPSAASSVIEATISLPSSAQDGLYFVWVLLQDSAPGSGPGAPSAPIMVGQSIADCLNSYAPGTAFCELAPGGSSSSWPRISGNRIVWEQRDFSSQPHRGVLLTMDLSIDQIWRVTGPEVDALMPDIDGERIVYIEFDCPDAWRYHVHDLATGVDEVFHSISCKWGMGGLSLSGERVTWHENRDDNWDVYLHDLSTGLEQRLTDHPADQSNPHVFRNLVAWSDRRHYGEWSDFYLYDLETRTETRITTSSTLARSPVISESRVVWADLNPVWFTLHEYSLESGEQRATNAVPFSNGLTLSPSGRYASMTDQVHLEPLNATDIYLYDFETDATIFLARHPYPPANVAVSDEYIIWEGPDGDTTRLYIARIEDLAW